MNWTDERDANVNETASCNGKSRRSNTTPSDGSSKSPSPKHPRPLTVEKVKLIMEQEGRSARNLLSWNIPMDDRQKERSKAKRASGNFMKYPGNGDASSERNTPKKFGFGRSVSGERKKTRDGNTRSEATSAAVIDRKQVSFRARYWAYLFENLRRAVDEIYATCQSDSSVVECKEVLLILDNYRHDFQALIDWIQLEEKLEKTDISDRPTSLSWEVRKSSPNRPKQKRRGASGGGEATIGNHPDMPAQIIQQHQRSKIYRNTTKNTTLHHPLSSSSDLVLNSSKYTKGKQKQHQKKHHPPKSTSMPSVATWADRVKGVVTTHVSSLTQRLDENENYCPEKLKEEEDEALIPDDDGGEWETVSSRSGRQSRNALMSSNNRGSQRSSFDSGQSTKHTLSRSSPDLKLSPSSVSKLTTENDTRMNSTENDSNNNKIATNNTTPPQINKKKNQGKRSNLNVNRNEKKNCETNNCETVDNTDDTVGPINTVATQDDDNTKETDEHEKQSSVGEYSSSLMKLEEREASLARTLHAQHDANIAVAEERERDLMRQIREVEQENSDAVEVDETDCESAPSSSCAKEAPAAEDNPVKWPDFLLMIQNEQKANAGLSWCDMVEQEENQIREPGGMVQMHEKLSSPSRKRTPAESKRKQEEKHRKAEVRRQEIEKARTQRIHELTEKVGEVRMWKNNLIKSQRDFRQSSQSMKLERAKEQREQKLRQIVEKAQAEDTKVNEIAFINELQEKNKRHEVLMRIDDHEMRLQELECEKVKMMEMKTAKEENVKERRRAIEKERQDRIEELVVKRKEQDARIEQQRLDREKEREKAAKEKARDRELRLSALNAAHEKGLSDLQKKIQMKHDESDRRHQKQLEIKKEKAVELTNVGRFSSITTPPNTPVSSLTKIESNTSVSSCITNKVDTDLEDKSCSSSHRDVVPIDTSDPKVENNSTGVLSQSWRKAMKKRIKKLRSRMVLRAKEFSKQLDANKQANSSLNKSKIARILKDINKILADRKINVNGSTTSVDRLLNELVRILDKKNSVDQNNFRLGGGFQVLEILFGLVTANSTKGSNYFLPDKSLALVVQVFYLACITSRDNQLYVLYSNRLPSLIDLLVLLMTKSEEQLQQDVGTDNKQKQQTNPIIDDTLVDVVTPLLFKAIATLIDQFASASPPVQCIRNSKQRKSLLLADFISSISLSDEKKATENYISRVLDIISYVVASGVLELLSNHLRQVRNLVRPGSNISSFVENSLWFLEVTTSFVAMRNRVMKICVDTQHNNQTTKRSGDGSRDGSQSNKSPHTPHDTDDPTHLLPLLQHTELMGVVSVLYGLLLHGAPERPTVLNSEPDKPQETIPSHTLCVARAVMRMINAAAEMDILLVQENLGAKGVALEFRHICAYLLWYCSNTQLNCNLLHEVIVCIGHFSLSNQLNQNIVNSGVQPTIVQQLGLLPFAYYSDPKLIHILFPTLISCCYANDNNFATLENDVSGSILATYIKSELEMKDKTDEAESKKESTNLMRSSITTISLADRNRYPTHLLEDAVKYFSHQQQD